MFFLSDSKAALLLGYHEYLSMKPAESDRQNQGYFLVHHKVSRKFVHEIYLCNCVFYPALNKHRLFIKIHSFLPISALSSSPLLKS